MDSNWFKIWPGKLRTVAASLPTGLQGAYFMQIAMVYLDEGGLPSDSARIAFITKLPLSAVEEVASYWEFLGRVEDGRLHLDCCDEILAERAHFSEKKALAGAKGGKAKSGSAKQSQAKPSKSKQKEAPLSSAKQSLASQSDNTDIQTNTGTNVPGADAPDEPSPPPNKSRPSDPLVAAFCEQYDAAGYGAPYGTIAKDGDFVQLAELRKRCTKANWPLTSERWGVGLANYFASDIEQRTIADLCRKFSTFHKGPLDRFGKAQKPSAAVNSANGHVAVAVNGITGNDEAKIAWLGEIRKRCKPDSPKAPLFDAAIAALQQHDQPAYEQASQQLANLGVSI